jgi:murein DD-endopeptidase MepM/ murein hydrolase activator NlpD
MDITVEQGEYVNTGDVIASVGDSGSLEGPKLHFEIYGNNQKMNPELWLAKPV